MPPVNRPPPQALPPIATEFDSDTDVMGQSPVGTVVHQETRVESASESEIDSHLRSLTRRTSIEELARSGKTRNLKTLSERDLKEWIKEALRRVISSTTSLGETQREQLLADTRSELSEIMSARQAEGNTRAEDARILAVLTAERDGLARSLAASEALISTRDSELHHQLAEAAGQRDSLATRVSHLEGRLARALSHPVSGPQELSDLRRELEGRDTQLAKMGAVRDEAQRIARDAAGRLEQEQERALAEKRALMDRIAAAERLHGDLEGSRAEAERRRAEAEARLTTATAQAASSAEQGSRLAADMLAALEAERQRLAEALRAAEAARGTMDERLRQAELDRDAARSVADMAAKRLAPSPDAPAGVSTEESVRALAALHAGQAPARVIVMDAQGGSKDSQNGSLLSRSPGSWLTAWRDPAGRLRTAQAVSRWAASDASDGAVQVDGLTDVPSILLFAQGILAAWRDADGHARIATLDDHGHLKSPPRDLGPALAPPSMSRHDASDQLFIVTTSAEGHVLLHDFGGASPQDLTTLLGAPAASGGASAWHWALEGSRHITYRDVHGLIHEYLELQGRWFHAELSTRTQAPAAAMDPIGYAPTDHEHILYLGTDGHVHELCFDANTWRHNDLSAMSSAPDSTGRPAGAYIAGRHAVVFRGIDGHAHYLRLRRDWRHQAFSELGPIAGDPQLGSIRGDGVMTYRAAGGQRRWARIIGDPATIDITDLPS